MKGPHHVFIGVKVYARLSADAGIHLGQQGGGNLDKINSPKIGGCCKAAEISSDATSQSSQHILAVKMFSNQVLIELLYRVQVFIFLSCRKNKNRYFAAALGKNCFYLFQIQRSHIGIRNDTNFVIPEIKGFRFFF